MSGHERTTAGEPDRWLRPQEVSEYIGIPIATLYRWRSMGEGPAAARVGRHLRYRLTDLSRWLEERVQEPRG
jgi:excisionase family DNA binding protein